MTPDVERQVILLQDLYSVLENLDADIRKMIAKNNIDVKKIEIFFEKGILRTLMHTKDGRCITQMFKHEIPAPV